MAEQFGGPGERAGGEKCPSPPPPAVPQLRDAHTPRAESAGSEDIFGVPEFQFTRSYMADCLTNPNSTLFWNSAVEKKLIGHERTWEAYFPESQGGTLFPEFSGAKPYLP